MKIIPTINPTIMVNMERLIVKTHAPMIDIKVGVSLLHGIYIFTLYFASSSSNVWLAFQAKNNVRSASACTALAQVSH